MWEVKISRQARKYIASLPRPERENIESIIEKFKHGPNPEGYDIKPLVGRLSYRLRAGKYRIIYEVFRREVRIIIAKVGPRGDVYK